MSHGTSTDVSFYALVHHVLDSSRSHDENLERRTGRRRRYSCVQWLAPYCDGKLPQACEFRQVQCIDLSAGGFSYLAAEKDTHEFVVVGLCGSTLIFVTAQVVRRSWIEFEGARRLAVGCQFVGKISEPSYQPLLAVH